MELNVNQKYKPEATHRNFGGAGLVFQRAAANRQSALKKTEDGIDEESGKYLQGRVFKNFPEFARFSIYICWSFLRTLQGTLFKHEIIDEDTGEPRTDLEIFFLQSDIEKIKRIRRWHADGTYEVCQGVRFEQCVILSGQESTDSRSTAFPYIYIFILSKMKSAYVEAFQEIERIIGEKLQFEYLHLDLEVALHNAFKFMNPRVKLMYCTTHLLRAWMRKMQSIRLWPNVLRKNHVCQEYWLFIKGLVHCPLDDKDVRNALFAKLQEYGDVDRYKKDKRFDPKVRIEYSLSTK